MTEQKPKSGRGGDVRLVANEEPKDAQIGDRCFASGRGGDETDAHSAGDPGDIVFFLGTQPEPTEVLRVRYDGVFLVMGHPVAGATDRLVYAAFRRWLIDATYHRQDPFDRKPEEGEAP